MRDARSDVPDEGASWDVVRVVWGLLLIWIGAALLLRWGWGVGLAGAGGILLAAQAYRRASGLAMDGFGLLAGLVLAMCGAWSILGATVDVVPLLCIAAGIALLLSTWSAHRGHHAEATHRPGA